VKQLREIKLKGIDHPFDVLLAIPIPKGQDPWGQFACLRGTEWEAQIPVLSGELLAHALHGQVLPLLNLIGVAPEVRLRRLKQHTCKLAKECATHDKTCVPCLKVPMCYVAPIEGTEKSEAASVVTLAWRQGFYVAVFTLEGEFSLR